MEANHGGYTWEDYTISKRRSTQSQGLMTYIQFIQELEDDVLPVEVAKRYKEYRSEYISTQKRAFFNTHKEEEWRNEHARQVAKEFLLHLRSGTLNLTSRQHGRGLAEEADFSAVLKAHPVSSQPRQIQVDIEQAHALIHKLDVEKGIKDDVLCSNDNGKMDSNKSCGGSVGPIVIIGGLKSVNGLEGIELLDTPITYLWRIHGVNYYGMIERNESKGSRHVSPDGKNYAVTEETEEYGAEWEEKLDPFWQERLRGQDPLEAMSSKENAAAVSGWKMRDDEYEWKYGYGGGANGYTFLLIPWR